MLHNLFEFDRRTVGRVMIPRSSMKLLDISAPAEYNLATIRDSGHSRFPLINAVDDEQVLGIVLAKDLHNAVLNGDSEPWRNLAAFCRDPLLVPESQRVSQLFESMRRHRAHMALVIDHTRLGLAIGLGLIAVGAGGIKPCVSAHVGDQFGRSNGFLLSRVFSWFYFSINLGAFVSMLLTPWLLVEVGASVAFAIPGVLMAIATLVFWSGRHRFVHIPPAGMGFVREALSRTGAAVIGRLALIYLFVAVFWALFDQTGSAWVLQAQHMDPMLFGWEVLPAQIQAANPKDDRVEGRIAIRGAGA